MSGRALDALARLVPEWKEGMRMRLYLFELEKLIRKPFYLTAATGSFLFTAIGWRVYAEQADFHAGEAQAVMLLLMELHGLLAAMLIIIFTAPVFAGEYSLKMEELLQTAANGMEKRPVEKPLPYSPFHCPFGDSSGFGLFIHPLCLGKRKLESRYDAACGRRNGYCSGCQLRPGLYCLIFPGDLRRNSACGSGVLSVRFFTYTLPVRRRRGYRLFRLSAPV